MPRIFEPQPNVTHAYHKDVSGDEYYGTATRGATPSKARWVIFKIEYTGKNWIMKYPNGDDNPKYIWDNVESLSYKELA